MERGPQSVLRQFDWWTAVSEVLVAPEREGRHAGSYWSPGWNTNHRARTGRTRSNQPSTETIKNISTSFKTFEDNEVKSTSNATLACQ